MHFLGIKHRETSPNWTLFNKNFISEFTYIKCIIQKISKKRVSVTLCATLVPHLWHMWHKYKCATLLWHKFYKLHLFHFSTYLVSKDENHLYIKSVFLKVVHKNDKKINFFTCVAIEHFFRSSFRFSPCLQLISPYLIKSYQNLLFYHAYCLSVS